MDEKKSQQHIEYAKQSTKRHSTHTHAPAHWWSESRSVRGHDVMVFSIGKVILWLFVVVVDLCVAALFFVFAAA